MKKSYIIFLIVFIVTACKIKEETKQWNLNESIGLKTPNPNDYTVLFIKWNLITTDSSQISRKKKFDEAVLKDLESNHLGGEAENDDSTETDLHFVVSKDYKNALSSILSVANRFNAAKKLIIYKREYNSADKWVDKVVYPE